MMKRVTAIVAVVMLLMTLSAVSVSAEGFLFRELSRTADEQTLTVVWNSDVLATEDVVEFDSVLIGETICPVTESSGNTLKIDIAALPAGKYPSLEYAYTLNGKAASLVVNTPFTKAGSVAVLVDMQINQNGTVTVKVTDASGAPVAGYGLVLSIGSMTDVEEKTGKNGTFTSRMTAEYGERITCKGVETVVGGVTYLATEEQALTRPYPTTTTVPPTTTTVEGDTTTTVDGETTTTVEGETTTTEEITTTTVATTTTTVSSVSTTVATIKGAGTTAKQDGKIAVNVSLDETVLSAFGMDSQEFGKKARLFISEEDYSNLTSRGKNILMLNLLTAQKQASEEQIDAAVLNTAYAGENRTAVTFDLSFLLLSGTTGDVVPVSAVPLGSTYVVQLPVPESMKNCNTLAITMFSGDTLMEPMKVDVNGGYFRLEINSLEPYTLIGFGEGGGGNGGSVLLTVLLIVGIVLIVGAAVLLYFLVIRKPMAAPQPQTKPYIPEDADENDIFSGRVDFMEINRRPPESHK